jgi:pSer/pThr/pTyr-binding forkhead associated (FHA) protein
MTLKLSVKKKSDISFSEDYEFKSFPIFLGRDNKNEVILPDSLKIISRKHAKILEQESFFRLVDLESANFTYLNEEKIEPNKEYGIVSGDKIKIGEYEMEVLVVKEEIIAEDNQKTMLFSSPFAEEVAGIAENLKNLGAKFSLDASPMKTDMLKFSILQSLNNLEKNETNKIIAEFFSENFLGNSWHGASEPREEIVASGRSEKKVYQFVQSEEKYNPQVMNDSSFSMHFSSSIDVLLETFAKLVQGFLQFRQEFFGVTIYHTLPVGSLNELKEYLFNPAISSEEERKRINLLNEEIQNLLSHQIGLLEGYKISVTEGSKALLQSLNPEAIDQELQKKNIQTGGLDWAKIIPAVNNKKILEAIKENYKKYISDPYHVEKKFFRPHYLKGYQKRSPSGRLHDEY